MQYIVSVDTTSASSLLLNRVRVLVVRFGDALPFAVDLQEKKDVREVDLAAPALFEDAHDGERFLEFQHVNPCLEILARADGVDIAVELFDAAALELPVEETEQAGILREQLLGVLAVALRDAAREFRSGLDNRVLVCDIRSHFIFSIFVCCLAWAGQSCPCGTARIIL